MKDLTTAQYALYIALIKLGDTHDVALKTALAEVPAEEE
jgi:hypothetical protein